VDVDVLVSEVGVGVGAGSLLPGVCISPPEASIEVQINTMVAKRKHLSLFIVLDPFGVEQYYIDREIVEPKNHNIISRRCD